MKGLFKLTTAALALVAFASCSNEDLFSNGESQQNKKGILVEVEDLIDANTTLTRSSYTPSGKQGVLNWNTSDAIRVTDATMVKYDIYSFDGDAFVFDAGKTGRTTAYLKEPKFASYPDSPMSWDNANMQSTGTYNISPYWTWSEDWEVEGAFRADLPLWGIAEKDATYGIKTTLKYLTAVLRINLENIPGNATNVRVTGWSNLAGTSPVAMASDLSDFTAVYATDDEIDDNATLVTDGTVGTTIGSNDYVNFIDVDVSGATKSVSTIFLPLIVQHYGLLTIEYSNNGGLSWTKFKDIENLDVQRRTWYNFTPSEAFKVDGTSADDITTVLEEKKDQSEEIVIETAQPTQLSTGDQTITLPETNADITLKLADLINSGEAILYIDAVGDYAGTLTLDIPVTDPTVTNVYINLPKANVVVNNLGTGTISLGGDNAPDNVANSLAVKCLVLNEDANIDNIFANAELGVGNSGNPDLKLVKGSTVNSIEFEQNYKADEIEINGTLATDLDMTAWKDLDNKDIQNVAIKIGNGADTQGITTTGDVTVTGGTVNLNIVTDGNVSVSGVTNATAGTTAGLVGGIIALTSPATAAEAFTRSIVLSEEAQVGGILPKTNHTFTLTVNDKAGSNGTATVDELTIAGTTAYVTNADVANNVTISDTEEAEAVKGTLTMAAKKTLNLNGGYINTLDISAAAAAANSVTIQHGSSAAYTAIRTLTGGNYIFSGKSVWNGKKIGDGTSDAGKKATLISTYATGKSDVYTAIELASATTTSKLYSNIDLAGEKWTMPALAGSFEGEDIDKKTKGNQFPTIENLYIFADDKSAAVNGAGLFATATAGQDLKNFTLKKVTSGIVGTKGVTNFGALVGNAAGALTINNVTVQSAEIATTKVNNVGGLVGTAGAIILIKVNATGLTLNGDTYIGGVVGDASASVTVNDNSTINVTAINVPVEHQSTPDITKVAENQTKYGAVGMIAGSAGAAVFVTPGKSLTVNDLITGNRQKMGYTWYYQNPGPGLRYYHGVSGDKNKLVKDWVWVGLRTDLTPAVNIDTADAFEASYGATAQPLLVKHDIYTACDK